MPSPGGQFFSQADGDIEDYFISDYQIIDDYIGDQLWTWGRDASNLGAILGINDGNSSRSTPVTTLLGGTNWRSVYRFGSIKTDGTLWIWGSNNQNNLGTNDSFNRSTPVTTFAGGNTWQTASLASVSAAVKSDGTLWTWGFNAGGNLGINATGNRSTPVTTFAGGNTWKSCAASDNTTAAIKTDGTLWVWGRNYDGLLGINDTNINAAKSTPVTTFAGGTNWKSVHLVGSVNLICAIKTDGTLWVWGRNNVGQLGTNDIVTRYTPVTTFAGGTQWKSAITGNGNVFAIKTDGTLWCWGNNAQGQLGTNNLVTRSTPVTTFAGGTNWKQVSAGGQHAAAIKTNGTLWTWGNGANGQLGTNNTTSSSTPITTLAGRNNWKSISCGGYYCFAVTSGLNVDLS